jgi:lysophospholipase
MVALRRGAIRGRGCQVGVKRRKGFFPISLTAMLLASPVLAIPEGNFAADYARLVIPYYETGVTGDFVGKGAVGISYRVFDRGPDAPAIVILPGRSEPYRKYAELIYDLGSRGYSIFIMDHRGQGASDRLTPLHDLGHVDDFNDYVVDIETFLNDVVLPRTHTKLFLLALSMGGAIGALYVSRHPKVFAAVVLSSPMFEINTGDKSATYAYFGSWWKVFAGAARYPVDGMDKYQYDPTLTVDQSEVTSSQARWDMYRQIIRDNPQLALGGVSYGWLYAALTATANIDQLGSTLEAPVVILEAGRDQIVKTGKYRWYCSHRPNQCTVIAAPFVDAQHEILQERDELREKALDLIVSRFQ